ncbi:hypothetical protein [Bifidobacterium platyrrhinorum]|uniref:Uncharacterized protein n=1 Tax=Bifidobacterium platyrrhinorum TaxID=2661628 RepID=A0A6L9SVI3_9BIFI|nr:hypothetical protein [Bifidobacterium platyrrhinorum]NEG56149.1 hypothetical protein [Bifidobacterium platyrrhinorum]
MTDHTDYWKLAGEYHCPQCARPLHMRTAQQNHTPRTSYRVRCTDPRHYLGPWKPSEREAYEAARKQLDGESA